MICETRLDMARDRDLLTQEMKVLTKTMLLDQIWIIQVNAVGLVKGQVARPYKSSLCKPQGSEDFPVA